MVTSVADVALYTSWCPNVPAVTGPRCLCALPQVSLTLAANRRRGQLSRNDGLGLQAVTLINLQSIWTGGLGGSKFPQDHAAAVANTSLSDTPMAAD